MTVIERLSDILHASARDHEACRSFVAAKLPDALAAMIAGSATSEGRRLACVSHLSPIGGAPLDAVARAVATTRLSEVDDIHPASCTTPGAIAIPTTLALSASFAASPERAAAAIVAGYQAVMRLGEAIDGPSVLYSGVWPTYFAAPVGAAAASSILLGLDPERTAAALAISLTQISGALGRPAEPTSRWLLIGLAARAGCVAALAAAQGYEGDLALLEENWLEKTHGVAFRQERLLQKPPTAHWRCSQKPYCGAKQTIAATEAFLEELESGLAVEEISAIRVLAPSAYADMIARAPTDRSGRIVSVGHQLALAALDRDALWDIERGPTRREDLARFADRVEVVREAALDVFYPEAWPAEVEVTTKGGAVRRRRKIHVLGDPTAPLDEEALEKKFLRLVGPLAGSERALQAYDASRRAISSAEGFAQTISLVEALSRGENPLGDPPADSSGTIR